MPKIKLLKIYNKIIVTSLIVFLSILVSCKPAIGQNSNNSEKSSSISKNYISYFVNDSTMLYFIKPLKFYSDKSLIKPDFTFNKVKNKTANVTMNFSIITVSKIALNEIKSIKFNNIAIENYKILFNEFSNNKNEIRITTPLDVNEFVKMDENSFFEIETVNIKSNNKPDKKTFKILRNIKNLTID